MKLLLNLIPKSFLVSLLISSQAFGQLPLYSYDAGPDLSTEMGRELIDLNSNMPNMPGVSYKIMGSQKFRPAFGPVAWRMRQEPNSVKILFIGQDATHIAEAAGRPATAGYGGRAQDLARYFGVNESAAFINTYAYTIKGQYGAFQSPYIYQNGESTTARFGSLVDNELWEMTQDPEGPIGKWRNDLISWIVRNNRNSLKLIVTFGGAARDAIASYVEGNGGKVGAVNERIMNMIQVPKIRLKYAGGNNEFPVPVDITGADLYEQILGREIDFSDLNEQQEITSSFKNNVEAYLPKMVFTKGGPYRNGLLNAAQLGGYDLNKININGVYTRSLKGLKLPDGSVIENDVLVVALTHPTALSSMGKEEASASIAKGLEVLAKYVEDGWSIDADRGEANKFAQGLPYTYSRSDIGPEYYDFGTPGTRMVPVSTASRMSGNNHVIIFGTRDRAPFDMNEIGKMTNASPAESLDSSNLFVTRARSIPMRYQFDPGPGEFYAKLIKENLNIKEIFTTKKDKDWDVDGIDAYNVKNHPDVGDFGHYRGTFKNPRVLVLADPDGYDDMITARALTGERGQYLHGLMRDLGINDQYLVIKTVPFGMDGASESEWSTVLEQTQVYRENLITSVLNENDVELVIADGRYATQEAQRLQVASKVPVVELNRVDGSKKSGIVEASVEIKKIAAFADKMITGDRANIPRTHLSFYARLWEGTSGDRVLSSYGKKFKGLAYAEVVPSWAFEQKLTVDEKDQPAVDHILNKFKINNLPAGNDDLEEFMNNLNAPLLEDDAA